MIATKIYFRKFRHALSPNQKAKSKQISISLKRQMLPRCAFGSR